MRPGARGEAQSGGALQGRGVVPRGRRGRRCGARVAAGALGRGAFPAAAGGPGAACSRGSVAPEALLVRERRPSPPQPAVSVPPHTRRPGPRAAPHSVISAGVHSFPWGSTLLISDLLWLSGVLAAEGERYLCGGWGRRVPASAALRPSDPLGTATPCPLPAAPHACPCLTVQPPGGAFLLLIPFPRGAGRHR